MMANLITYKNKAAFFLDSIRLVEDICLYAQKFHWLHFMIILLKLRVVPLSNICWYGKCNQKGNIYHLDIDMSLSGLILSKSCFVQMN